MPTDPEAPKLIVDSDWKSQAHAEKERLAAEESKGKTEGAGRSAAGQGGAEDLPPADFPSLVGMLMTQALMYLGGVADRRTGTAIFDPDTSRFYIDLLAVLEEKTRGNLLEAEQKDLTGVIHELRLRYLELSRAVARQVAEGKGGATIMPGAAGLAGGAGGGGPGSGGSGPPGGTPPMIRVG